VEETVNRTLLAVKHITLAVDKLRELRGARIYSLAVGWKCLATLGVPVPTLAVMGRRAVLGAGSSALTVRLHGDTLIVRLAVLAPNIIM